MNNTGRGPWLVAQSTSAGTQELRGGNISTAAVPQYDAASMAAETVATSTARSQQMFHSPRALHEPPPEMRETPAGEKHDKASTALDADCDNLKPDLASTPCSAAEALSRLHTFDISTAWGPSQSCTRRERWWRLKSLTRAPAGWEWVEDIFRHHPALADSKPGEYRRIITTEPTKLIPDPRTIPGLTPWSPGTCGLYPNFNGSKQQFPIWNLRVDGMQRQQSMFTLSDAISPTAFYVAADVWSRVADSWRLGKVFGAFCDAASFANLVLMGPQRAPTRCFYEIIREDLPCKAYFDLEIEPGVMSAEEGSKLCQQVTVAWAERVRARWPQALQQCPKCLEVLILDGSRKTKDGWKVSYHLVYPWLTFPCNNSALKIEATALSSLPCFHYLKSDGTQKCFIDSSVYSRNRQFRLAYSYKLSDATQTPLRLPGRPTLPKFLLSCVTRIEPDSWRVPADLSAGPFTHILSSSVARPRPQSRQALPCTLADSDHRPLAGPSSDVMSSLSVLLEKHGLSGGELRPMQVTMYAASFRWQVAPGSTRPCLIAQIWRPSNPTHVHNGAVISYDRSRAVFLKCLHPECLRLGRGPGTFLGYIPQNLMTLSTSDDESPRIPNGIKRLSCSLSVASSEQLLKKKSAHEKDESVPALGPALHSAGPSVAADSPPAEPSTPGNQPSPSAPNVPTESVNVAQSPQRPPRTFEQSLRSVFSRNQADAQDSFAPWHATSGQWGGRLPSSPARPEGSTGTAYVDTNTTNVNLESAAADWALRAIQAPFFVPPPASVCLEIQKRLDFDNNKFAQESGGILPGWADLQDRAQPPTVDQPNRPFDTDTLLWGVQPPAAWFDTPLGRRTPIGHDLITQASSRIEQSGSQSQVLVDSPSIWTSPFTVAFISVGFRRLRHSLQGVLGLLEQHRPDILFLGDLGTSRHHIGRLRLRIQAAVDDEWFLFTDIRDVAGYPVGTGAMVHASAAKLIKQVSVPCPAGLDHSQWSLAVSGRILLLEMDNPEVEGLTWFVGVNQHVATNENLEARAMVLSTLAHLVDSVQRRGGRLILMGDANAAPEGGRWGYSLRSKTRAADQQMNSWLAQSPLKEVSCAPLRATWKACLLPKKAVLDRAWVLPAHLPASTLSVSWASEWPVFDHAMILLRLPSTVTGLGFAGACRQLHLPPVLPSGRINLSKFRKPEVLAEWSRLLDLSLSDSEGRCDRPVSSQQETTADPYQALKHAELLATQIAQVLAPRRFRRPGEVCRSFSFGGHRAIYREINHLCAARAYVKKILLRQPQVIECPHRITRWNLLMSRLPAKLSRSGHACPAVPLRPGDWYFRDEAQNFLSLWLDQAKIALSARWAAVREDIAKARFANIQQARQKLIRSGGVLDSHLLRAALGKRQPRPRMWGISPPVSAPVSLGVSYQLPYDQHLPLLLYLNTLQETAACVRVEGSSQSLNLWFQGPRAVGDFLVRWCSQPSRRNPRLAS